MISIYCSLNNMVAIRNTAFSRIFFLTIVICRLFLYSVMFRVIGFLCLFKKVCTTYFDRSYLFTILYRLWTRKKCSRPARGTFFGKNINRYWEISFFPLKNEKLALDSKFEIKFSMKSGNPKFVKRTVSVWICCFVV